MLHSNTCHADFTRENLNSVTSSNAQESFCSALRSIQDRDSSAQKRFSSARQKSNLLLLHDCTVDCEQNTENKSNASISYKSDTVRLLSHQLVARALMDFGRVSLADYYFLIYISVQTQDLKPRDYERYRDLILENGAIATSLICGLPLPVEVQP